MKRIVVSLVVLALAGQALAAPAKGTPSLRGKAPDVRDARRTPPPAAAEESTRAKTAPEVSPRTEARTFFSGRPLGEKEPAVTKKPHSRALCLAEAKKTLRGRRSSRFPSAEELCSDDVGASRVGAVPDRRPVVYHQSAAAVFDDRYEVESARWERLRYHPAGIGAMAPADEPLYSGFWHKNASVESFEIHRDLAPSAFDALDADLRSEGHRVLDLDAHVSRGRVRLHAIWVRESSRPEGRAHHGLTRKELEAKIADYRDEGFRPTRINGYRAGDSTQYAAVWVADGIDDFQVVLDARADEYADAWSLYRGLGYAPIDAAAYPAPKLRWSGIWVRDGGIRSWRSLRGLTAAGLEGNIALAKKQNLVLVDLDAYRDGDDTRFSAIFHRRPTRNALISNLPLSGASIDALERVIEEFITDGEDGARGSLGFFVEDTESGNYIAFNPHEPHYLASTSKVLIAGKVIESGEIELDESHELLATDWRGEDTRGFDEDDIGETFSLETFAKKMLRGSDTASTDKLHGLVEDREGAGAFDDHLADDVDLQNVGELTSICELDKRIFSHVHACVMDIPCHVFETFTRGKDPSVATPSQLACLTAVLPGYELGTEPYYATLANTITPAAYARFWRRTTTDAGYTAGDQEVLLALMGGASGYNPAGHDTARSKNGGKNRVQTQVGYLKDDGQPDISFALFTEDWHWNGIGELFCTSGVPCAVENALECGQQIVTDALQCGTEVVKCGTELVTDAAICGTEMVTSAAQCGYDLVTDAALCGTELVTDAARCAFSFGNECEVAATCEVAARCPVPLSCEADVFCEEPATCTIESCEPILCEEEEIQCDTASAWSRAAMTQSLRHAVDFLLAAAE